jgi:O-succinylbenzoic acid--CoA ligase
MNALFAALALRAERDGARPALLAREHVVSYAELAARARSAASWLARAGVEPGDRVSLLLGNEPVFVELFFGALARGATLVPHNVRLAAPELAAQLDDAEPALLVHGVELAAPVHDAAARARRAPRAAPVGAWLPYAAPCTGDVLACESGADAAIVYTSGTSGRAKGARLGTEQIVASAAAAGAHLGVRAGDRWLACLPLFHVGGLAIAARMAVGGVAMELHERFDELRVAERLAAGAVEFASLVPAMLARVLRRPGFRASPTLRCVLLGGAAAPEPLLDAAERAGIPVATSYGLTEAASQVATRRPGDPRAGLEVLPGTRVRVVAEAGRDCAPDAPGEILVAGPTVMRGYWRDAEATARTLAGGWLHTGDVGALDAAGRLRVLARRSDLIVSGGENVYPAEVETVLASHPSVREVAVAGVADTEFGARPAAWIVSDKALDADALRAFCRARLAGYKVPIAFHRVGELPRNAGGKVRRDRLVAEPLGPRAPDPAA